MESSGRNFISQMDYKPPMVIKVSDFSIDHILNRAGSGESSYRGYHLYRYKSPVNDAVPNRLDSASDLMGNGAHHYAAPILDWLQYSRYHPPRIQSK